MLLPLQSSISFAVASSASVVLANVTTMGPAIVFVSTESLSCTVFDGRVFHFALRASTCCCRTKVTF